MNKVLRSVVLAVILVGVFGSFGLDLAPAQGKKAEATATFDLYKDKSGKFRFRFKDSTGKTLAISGKGYATKGECQQAIDTIKREAAKATVNDQAK